ncbi:phosphopantetheinyl transferase [Streptomyces sp. CB03234]|nr:phosphopantetheinyl transferase [Streptomyces sp. CB03234]
MTGHAAAVGTPLRVRAVDGPWEEAYGQLTRTGTVVVHGWLDDWLPGSMPPERLRGLLGRDWHRYQSFAQPRLRERFAASRLLLRRAAAMAIETEAELVDLAYLQGGRPYVRGCDQIDVSLSHTEELIVVGITRSGRLGVDVERADRRLSGTGSESQALTPYERAQLDAGGDAARNDGMVRLWTLKEAYSKALGTGLRFRFTEFGFRLEDGGGARLVRPDGTPVTSTGVWSFRTFGVGGRYVVSVAVHDTGFGAVRDLSVGTTLDKGFLDVLLGGPGSGYPAGLFGDPYGVDAVAGPELADDGRQVVADGALGEEQAPGDLGGVRAPGGQA